MRKLLSALLLAALVTPPTWANTAEGGSGAPGLVPLAPITVPIIDADRLQGALQITLTLHAADAAAATRATDRLPVLRAAAIAAALDFARIRASTQMPVDAARLDADLTQAIKAVEPGIAQVLILEVSAMPA